MPELRNVPPVRAQPQRRRPSGERPILPARAHPPPPAGNGRSGSRSPQGSRSTTRHRERHLTFLMRPGSVRYIRTAGYLPAAAAALNVTTRHADTPSPRPPPCQPASTTSATRVTRATTPYSGHPLPPAIDRPPRLLHHSLAGIAPLPPPAYQPRSYRPMNLSPRAGVTH